MPGKSVKAVNIMNNVIGFFIKWLARITGNDPVEFLVKYSDPETMDQERFNKLLETL